MAFRLRALLEPTVEQSAGGISKVAVREVAREISVALLTGGGDRPYALGLASALLSKGLRVDFIGSDDLDNPELRASPRLNFLNLRGSHQTDVSLAKKASRVLMYYARLLRYASVAKAKIFHILWNNKFQLLDRTLLMLYYKLLGKRIVFTAHNVNAGKRDSNDSLTNRLTLKIQYRLSDHIFVHTEKMKSELLVDFGVQERAVTVTPFGINNSVPNTNLTSAQAKGRLGIKYGERTILFFGNIEPYKGLEFLVEAFQMIAARSGDYRLIIAGNVRAGAKKYGNEVQRLIRRDLSHERIIQRIEHIPDEETELYFKAADLLALPYTYVSQSGVLFTAYSFGLPVIACDVGSLREDIIEGKTGFLCKPCDPADLAETIAKYFESDLFENLASRRREIREYAGAQHSWELVGQMTRDVYAELLVGRER